MTATETGPGWSLPEGYRIDLFSGQQLVTAEDVVQLWTREALLIQAEARRRVEEILLVATDRQQRLAGISTTYRQRNERLRADLWHSRVFVAEAHRQSHLAVHLALIGRDHLEQRFIDGTDRRAIGIIFNVESEILKRSLPQASWPRTDFVFVGENARGDHVRAYYFPGALAPEPDQGSA